MAAPSADVDRLRRELRADPASMRWVPLADALRRAGELSEAEQVLQRGLASHPGLRSAMLVLARVAVDLGDTPRALTLLDELYPRDRENIALVQLYVPQLVSAGRLSEAEAVIDAASFSSLPPDLLDELRAQLPVTLGPEAMDEVLPSLPGSSLEPMTDLFAVPRVERRVADRRSGVRRLRSEGPGPFTAPRSPQAARGRAAALQAWLRVIQGAG